MQDVVVDGQVCRNCKTSGNFIEDAQGRRCGACGAAEAVSLALEMEGPAPPSTLRKVRTTHRSAAAAAAAQELQEALQGGGELHSDVVDNTISSEDQDWFRHFSCLNDPAHGQSLPTGAGTAGILRHPAAPSLAPTSRGGERDDDSLMEDGQRGFVATGDAAGAQASAQPRVVAVPKLFQHALPVGDADVIDGEVDPLDSEDGPEGQESGYLRELSGDIAEAFSAIFSGESGEQIDRRKEMVVASRPVAFQVNTKTNARSAHGSAARLDGAPHHLEALQNLLIHQVSVLVRLGASKSLWDVAFTIWERFKSWYVMVKQRSLLVASTLSLVGNEKAPINVHTMVAMARRSASGRKKRTRTRLSVPGDSTAPTAEFPPRTAATETEAGPSPDSSSDSSFARDPTTASVAQTLSAEASHTQVDSTMPPPTAPAIRSRASILIGALRSQVTTRVLEQHFDKPTNITPPIPDELDVVGEDSLLSAFDERDGSLDPSLTLGIATLALAILGEPLLVSDVVRLVARGVLPFLRSGPKVGGSDSSEEAWRRAVDNAAQRPDRWSASANSFGHKLPSCRHVLRSCAALVTLFDLKVEPLDNTMARLRGHLLEAPMHAPWCIPRVSLARGVARLSSQLLLPVCFAEFCTNLAAFLETENLRLLGAKAKRVAKVPDLASPGYVRPASSVSTNPAAKNRSNYWASRSRREQRQPGREKRDPGSPRATCVAIIVIALKLVYPESLAGDDGAARVDAPAPFWDRTISEGKSKRLPRFSALLAQMHRAMSQSATTVASAEHSLAEYASHLVFPLVTSRLPGDRQAKTVAEIVNLLGDVSIRSAPQKLRAQTSNNGRRRQRTSHDRTTHPPHEEPNTARCEYFSNRDLASASKAYTLLLGVVSSLVLESHSVVHEIVTLLEQQCLLPHLEVR